MVEDVSGASISGFNVKGVGEVDLALLVYHLSVLLCQLASLTLSGLSSSSETGILSCKGTLLFLIADSILIFCLTSLNLLALGFNESLSSFSSREPSLNNFLFEGSFLVTTGSEFSFSDSGDFYGCGVVFLLRFLDLGVGALFLEFLVFFSTMLREG